MSECLRDRLHDFFGKDWKDSLSENVFLQFPNFEFEVETCSPHSFGVVEDSEKLARLIYEPHHWKLGNVLPDAFLDVFGRGCSVERLVRRTDVHAFGLSREKSPEKPYKGYLPLPADVIRRLKCPIKGERFAGVADTALHDNHSHADIIGQRISPKPEMNKRRLALWREIESWGAVFVKHDRSAPSASSPEPSVP